MIITISFRVFFMVIPIIVIHNLVYSITIIIIAVLSIIFNFKYEFYDQINMGRLIPPLNIRDALENSLLHSEISYMLMHFL